MVARTCAKMAAWIVPTLALLASSAAALSAPTSSAAALSAPPASATIASINPCPRRQLLTYVAHTGGGKVSGSEVLAKREDSEWLTVGRVAAADDTFEALSAAAARQERLIAEHATRLYTELRRKPGDGSPPIELGLRVDDDVVAVPAPMKRDFVDAATMTAGGFRGFPKKAGGSDMYAQYDLGEGVYGLPYDRAAVRAELARLVEGDAVVVFGWSSCFFCVDAEQKLRDADVPFKAVHVDLWRRSPDVWHDADADDSGSGAARAAKNVRKATNPLQAELALLTGRCSVPVVFVKGELLAAGDDDAHGKVDDALASGDIAIALAGNAPWTAPPGWAPPAATRTCRVCREKYSDATNGDRSCCYHPGSLRGESARKGDWDDAAQGRPTASGDGGELVWTYSCCGQADGAPGCTYDRCRSYDDP